MNRSFLSRAIIPAAMLALLVLLASRLVVGAAAHEWLGVAFFALVVVHNIGHRKWWTSLARRRFSARTGAVTTSIIALAALLVVLLSTIGPLATVLPLAVPSFWSTWQARSFHAGLACWIFVLCLIHAGIFWGPRLVSRWHRATDSVRLTTGVAYVLVLAVGIYDFAIMGFFSHLLFSYGFSGLEVDGPLPVGIAEVLAAGLPFFSIGALIGMTRVSSRARSTYRTPKARS